jgi:outer membrane lipoprotein SlyB
VPILLLFLFLAVVAVVAIRQQFRSARNAREALVSPEVFAIAGALLGISAGMVWFVDRSYRRINIEQGSMHALLGAVVGGLVGVGVEAGYSRLRRAKIIVAVLTLMLLAGSIGAPIGWLYGDIAANPPVEVDQSARRGMMWGAVIGCFVGLALGLLEVWRGGKRVQADAVDPKVENAVP